MSYQLYTVKPDKEADNEFFKSDFFEKIPLRVEGQADVRFHTYRTGFRSVQDRLVSGEYVHAVLIPRINWLNSIHHLFLFATSIGLTEVGDAKNPPSGVPVERLSPKKIVYWPSSTQGSSTSGAADYGDYTSSLSSTTFIVKSPSGYTPPLTSVYNSSNNPGGTYEYGTLEIAAMAIFQFIPSSSDVTIGIVTHEVTKPSVEGDTAESVVNVEVVSGNYVFNGWKTPGGDDYEFPAEGVVLSNEGKTITYQYDALSEDVEIVASVTIKSFVLTASVLDDIGGQVSVLTEPNDGVKYVIGTEVSVSAIREDGFLLLKWIVTVDGNAVDIFPEDEGFGNPLVVAMDADTEIMAVFVAETFSITPIVDTLSLGRGDVSRLAYDPATGLTSEYPAGGVMAETSVKLSAVVIAEGDRFAGWFRGVELISDEPDLIVLVSGDAIYTAKFGGTVTVNKYARLNESPDAILSNATAGACAAGGSAPVEQYNFIFGESVRLLASSGTNAFFAGWYDVYTTGAQSAQRTDLAQDATVTPDESFAITAVFSYSEIPFYVRMTNGLAVYGSLSMTSGIPGAVTQMTKEEYDQAMDDRYGAPGGGMGILEGNEDASDRFYSVAGAKACSIFVSMLSSSVSFQRWQISQIKQAGGGGFITETAQDLSFSSTAMLNVASDCVIFALYNSSEPSRVTVNYESGSTSLMGAIRLSPTGSNYLPGPPAQGDYYMGRTVTVSAYPENGFRFSGWYVSGSLISASAEYSFPILSGGTSTTFLARFSQDDNAVFTWEGGEQNKLVDWQSKLYKSPVPFSPTCVRLYADGYSHSTQVKIRLGASPNVEENGKSVEMVILSQDMRRIPIMRPEKYVQLCIETERQVTDISVSTSAEGLNA